MAAILALSFFLAVTPASAETRKLKLYFLHTGERAEITYKRNGKYISGGLKKINRFLRDWRRNEPTKMDPRLLDLVWEIYKETESKKYIHVISAYRSLATNNLLKKRGRGVAKKSQHTLGKAMDFFIPGVSLRKLRNIGLRKGLGGVGYYPKSGSPFVHMDTGRVRHWPRMSRSELARVFPKGKTLHVPTDGKPLARYNQAKAEYERKSRGKGRIVVASAEEIRKKPSRIPSRGEEEDGAIGSVSAPKAVATTRQPAPQPTLPAVAATPAPVPETVIGAPELTKPQPVETPQTILAALPASSLPIPLIAPRAILVAAAPEELVQPETNDNELVENSETDSADIALIVPTRAKRAVVQVASLEPETTVAEVAPRTQPTVFSATEIEDLRRQVYATLKSDFKTREAAPRPVNDLDVGRIRVAAAPIDPVLQTTTAFQVIVPEKNPRSPASSAIENKLEPETQSEPLVVAALQPIEPGAKTTETISIPKRSPVEKPVAAEPKAEVVTAAVAVPSPATRSAPIIAENQAPETPIVASAPTEPQTTKLDRFKTANLDKRLVGKWALSADASISEIADIQPPAYGRNVIRELPSTVLLQGFSLDNGNVLTQGFSGSSIEFIDFKRF